MAKQPAWANTPHRRLLAVCPDCCEFLDMHLTVSFKRRGTHVVAEFGPARVPHECDFATLKAAAARRLHNDAA